MPIETTEQFRATLTETEFCKKVGISRITAWRLRNAGKLPHCRIGSKVLYKPEHVEQFLTAHEKPITKTSTGRK